MRAARERGWPARTLVLNFYTNRFVRFLCVGFLNTVFGYTAFLLALKLGAEANGALLVSTLTGIAFNFQTSRRFVFKSRQKSPLPRFIMAYGVIFAINCAALAILKHAGFSSGVGQAILVLPMALLAFILQRGFVFAAGRSA